MQACYLYFYLSTYHQCKLQWMKPPRAQVELCQRSGCKVQGSGSASVQVRAGCSNNMQLQPPLPPTSQDQHRHRWSAQCSNHCNLHKGSALGRKLCALTQVAMIAALCTPMAPVLILSWLVASWLELHVVAASHSNLCWYWSWPLHLAPWPLTQTLHLRTVVSPIAACAGSAAFSYSHWCKYSTSKHGGIMLCNLRCWCFPFLPLVPILHLHSSNLDCVVVICARGGWSVLWRW